jgi:hypothetical protein
MESRSWVGITRNWHSCPGSPDRWLLRQALQPSSVPDALQTVIHWSWPQRGLWFLLCLWDGWFQGTGLRLSSQFQHPGGASLSTAVASPVAPAATTRYLPNEECSVTESSRVQHCGKGSCCTLVMATLLESVLGIHSACLPSVLCSLLCWYELLPVKGGCRGSNQEPSLKKSDFQEMWE